MKKKSTPWSRRRGYRREILALLLALVVPAGLDAQPERLQFKRFTVDEGLPQIQITALSQDGLGFLWVGTPEGLQHYDGATFRRFQKGSELGDLATAHINELFLDRIGRLWIGTDGAGLARFDPRTSTLARFLHDPDDKTTLGSNQVSVVLEDRAGNLWIATVGGGLARHRPEDESFDVYRHVPGDPTSLAHDTIHDLTEDASGHLWVATFGGGLDRLDPVTGHFIHHRHDEDDPASLGEDFINALAADHRGGLWIGTRNRGLDHFDPATGRFIHHRHDEDDPTSLATNRINALLETSPGDLWVGLHGGGLARLDPSTGRFGHHRYHPVDELSLTDDRVVCLFEDRGGLMWIGTYAGLNLHNPATRSFVRYRADPLDDGSLSANRVRSVYEDRAGTLWIGTTEGLDRLDRSTGRFDHYRHRPEDPTSLPDTHVSTIHEDSSGDLWVGSPFGGAARLDRARGTWTRFRHDPEDPASLSLDDVIFIHEDAEQRLWIGTWGGGLNLFDRANASFVRYRHDPGDPESFADNHLLTVHEGRNGNLWIGTWSHGIERFDPATGRVEHHDSPESSSATDLGSDHHIQAIHELGDGSLLIGTWNGGLKHYDPQDRKAETYTLEDGLPSNSVYAILPDGVGRFWLATLNGLARFDPSAESFTNFDTTDGLAGNEHNIHASLRGADGTLYFGTKKGLTAFHPRDITRNDHIPPVALTSFKIFDREIALAPGQELVELGPEDTAVSFELAALDFAAPRKNRYAYRLQGLDDRWVELGSRREILLGRLEPGSYVLEARGSNNHGVWNEEGVHLELKVIPPLWRTWWFRALSVISLAALVGGAVRYRMSLLRAQHRALELEIRERRRAETERERLIAELEAKNTELERFTYTVSHDLKSPLFTIQGFLGLLRRDVESGDRERLEGDLDRIQSAASTMGRLLDELLALSRIGRVIHPVEEIDLGELVRESARAVGGRLDEQRLELRIADNLPTARADPIRISEVFQNLLDNAARFTADQTSPRVEVSWRRDGEETVVFVRDNGLGVDARYHEKIFGLFERVHTEVEGTGIGLTIARRILEVHGGRLWVESEGAGQGSTFCLTWPGLAGSDLNRESADAR